MNTTEIANMLRNAGEPIKGVIINKQVALTEGATWCECTLTLSGDDTLEVVFVIYADGAWFSPIDWQGPMPAGPDEIGEFDWRVGASGKPAFVINGLPRML